MSLVHIENFKYTLAYTPKKDWEKITKKISDSETDDVLACSAYLLVEDDNEVKKQKRDIFKGRHIFGQFHTLYQEMRASDRESFFR